MIKKLFFFSFLMLPSFSFAARISGGGGSGGGGGETGPAGADGTSIPSAYGALYLSSANVSQQLTGTPSKLTIFNVNGLSNQTTPDHTFDGILVSTTGIFNIYANIVSTISTSGGTRWWYQVAIDGISTDISCTDIVAYACGMSGVKNITAGSTVTVNASANVSGSRIYYADAQLVVTAVGGAGGGGGGTGDIESVTAGPGLSGGGTSGAVTLSLDPNATHYIHNQNTLQSGATFYVSSGTVIGQLSIGSLKFPDGTIQVTSATAGGGTGDIESVTAGSGLSGGGASGAVTLSLDPNATHYIHNQNYQQSGSTASPTYLHVYGSATVHGGIRSAAAQDELLRVSRLDAAGANRNALIGFYADTGSGDTLKNSFGYFNTNGTGFGLIDESSLIQWRMVRGFFPDKLSMRIYNLTGANYVSFESSTSLSGNIDFILPVADGTNGQALVTDGNGNLSFTTISGGGGGGGSALEVFSNFDALKSSPTASISLGDAMKMTVSGSTAVITVDQSSVTLQGQGVAVLISTQSFSGYNTFLGTTQFNGSVLTTSGTISTALSGGVDLARANPGKHGVQYFGGNINFFLDSVNRFNLSILKDFRVPSDHIFAWSSLTTNLAAADTALARNAAGIVEVNNGTVGSYGALRVGAPTSATVGFEVRGAAAQVANLQRWMNFSGVDLATVSATGVGTFAGLALPSLPSNNCLGTDSTGVMIAGTCGGGGGGSSSLAVGTGTASNFTNNITSPTAAISFLGSQFKSLATGTTNHISLVPSIAEFSLGTVFSGGGSVITVNSTSTVITVPYNSTISTCVVAGSTGSITIDVRRTSYSSYTGSSGTTSIIGAGNYPGYSVDVKGRIIPSGWTSTTLAADDIIEFAVTAVTDVTGASIVCKCTKTP